MKNLPNILTILRILLTPVFVFCLLMEEHRIFALAIFIFASITDWYDGYLARKFGYSSEWGNFLDPLADKVLVLAAFFSLVYLGLIKFWMVMVIIIRDSLITFLRSYAMSKGKPMVTNFFGKIKTLAQMIVIGLILIVLALQSWYISGNDALSQTVILLEQYHVIYSSMLFITLLTAASGLLYLYQNRQSIRQLTSF